MKEETTLRNVGIPLGQDARDRGMDNFLLTFARRVDVREAEKALPLWKREKALEKEGISHDGELTLFNRMESK